MNIIDAMTMNLRLDSIDASRFQRRAQSELHCRCEMDLAGGDASVALATADLRGARIVFIRSSSPFALHFAAQGEMAYCIVVASGSVRVSGRSDLDLLRGDAFAVAGQAAWRADVAAGAYLCILAYPKADADRLLERMMGRPASEPLELAAPFRSAGPTGRILAALVQAATEGLMGERQSVFPHSWAALRDAMIVLLLETLPHSGTAALIQVRREDMPSSIRTAVDFIAANAKRELSIGAVAAAAGLSLRALQQNFQRFLKAPPQDYIKSVRLQGVRRELLDISSRRPIEDIAAEWGFANRGHFANQYRKVYGERPSETRRSR